MTFSLIPFSHKSKSISTLIFRSSHLIEVQERELYNKGMTLDKSQPGHYVSVFNKQYKKSKQMSSYAYATLQASSLLSKQ